MKDKLCEAFCGDLNVRAVPAGLAVSTPFLTPDGDRIGFYIVKEKGLLRIQDDGLMAPTLEASGLDLLSGPRAPALHELQAEYGVQLDPDDREFFIGGLTEAQAPAAALKFMAFCLRVRDFLLMVEDRAASTFRDDAERMLRDVLGERVTLRRNAPVTSALSEFPADFVLQAAERPPVGVFLGVSDNRILEALFMQMRARHEVQAQCSIVALVEAGTSLSARVRQQAMNRLDAVTEFRSDEFAAVQRIAREVVGRALAFQ